MSVPVEALTLVMRRTTLNASYPGGADAMADWLASEDINARWVVTDEHLIAASFLSADLTPVVEVLVERGFVFEPEEGDFDYVVVDAMLGLAYGCDWLEYTSPEGERYSLCWLAGTSPGDVVVPEGHTLGEGTPVRMHTRWDPDMIRMGMNGSAEAWLNTRTGQIEHHAPQPCRTEPGPIMQAVLDGLPEAVQEVRLSDGDAEELFGTFPVGSLSCVLRVRTLEGQGLMEAVLFPPLDIPAADVDILEDRLTKVDHAAIDPHSATPCGYMNIRVNDLPTPPVMKQLMDILSTAVEGIVVQNRRIRRNFWDD